MTQLYRMTYLRGQQLVGVTFSAADIVTAISFTERWEKAHGLEVLTMKPQGLSKFPSRPYKRLRSPWPPLRESSQALPGGRTMTLEGLTSAEQFQLEVQGG